VRNIKTGRLFTAGSRMLFALMCFLAAGRYLFQSEFWHGATKPHFPRDGLAIKESGKKLFPNTHWNENT
jgi:hypothetical protein